MPIIKQFPNGYDVTVCTREDILECLDSNVVDKELVLAVIDKCETDAAKFVRDGVWAGIPFIGTYKTVRAYRDAFTTPEHRELNRIAKESLDKQQYSVFRKGLAIDISLAEKKRKLDLYRASQYRNKHREHWCKLCNRKAFETAQDREVVAKFATVCLLYLKPCDNEETEYGWDTRYRQTDSY